MKSRFLFASAALTVLAVPFATTALIAQGSTTAVAATSKPAIGAWGVDLAGGDPSIKPGDDYFRYTAGKWYDAMVIPADRPSTGSFYDLRERTQDQNDCQLVFSPHRCLLGSPPQPAATTRAMCRRPGER